MGVSTKSTGGLDHQLHVHDPGIHLLVQTMFPDLEGQRLKWKPERNPAGDGQALAYDVQDQTIPGAYKPGSTDEQEKGREAGH